MGRRRKARLTRRLQRQYLSVLAGEPDPSREYFYCRPHKQWACSPCGNPWGAYTFATRWGGRKGVDIKRLQRIVLKCKNALAIFRFARDVPEANVKRFQNAILECGDSKLIYMFADQVPGASKEFLEREAFALELLEEVMNI